MILVLGKGRSQRVPNLGCKGAESPHQFDASPKNSARDVMHEQACCRDEAANHQLPIAAAFWIIQIVCEEECSNLMAKFNADSLLYSLSHLECDSHTVHMLTQLHLLLVQWSRHYSHTCIPVQSPWLPGDVNVVQTILVIWTMAGLFPDSPCIFPHLLLFL